MEEFISKEFECQNHLNSDNKVINSIVDFFRTVGDKIEIENKNGKRVNAKSFVKMMGLDIKYGDIFTLYVSGEDKIDTLKRIEELLDKKEFYTLEKIEELNKEKESEGNKLLEEEILYLTPDDKKDIVKETIEEKVNLLKEKRDSFNLEYSKYVNYNIVYVKDNDKTEIYNMINNNIPDVVEIIASHYEIPINKNELKTFVSELINIVEKKEMKYFYEYLLFNSVKKYFYNQFDTLFIKKLIGIGPIKVEYDMTINEGFVNDAIKTLDYVLEDKAKSCDYSIDIYMMPSTNVSSVDLYRLINIIQNIGKIYEINEHLMDNIIEKIKENYELKNVSKKFYSNNNEYLELVRELKDDLQKEFENVYVAKVRDNKNISIDYKCLNRFLRRL